LRIAVEQVGRRHDHAARAIAALSRLLIDEGLLQRVRLVERAEPFERGHLVSLDRAYRRHAGASSRAVDQHRAGAALRQAAAVFGAIELEIVAQHVEQRRVRLGIDRARRPLTFRLMAIVGLLEDGSARCALLRKGLGTRLAR